MAFTALIAAAGQYAYDQPGDRRFVSNTAVLERTTPSGATDNRSYKIAARRAQMNAAFTARPPAIDGVREAAWAAATSHPVDHKFNADMTADAPDASAHGTVRLLWDGPVLYVLVEVTGDSTQSDRATPDWNRPSYTPESDGLFVFMDVFNDQWGIETDTQGVFF